MSWSQPDHPSTKYYISRRGRVRNITNTNRVEVDKASTNLAGYWGNNLTIVVCLVDISGLSQA